MARWFLVLAFQRKREEMQAGLKGMRPKVAAPAVRVPLLLAEHQQALRAHVHDQASAGLANLQRILLQSLQRHAGRNLQAVLHDLAEIADLRDGGLEGIDFMRAHLPSLRPQTEPDSLTH